MTRRLFFYGTLRHVPLLEIVLGRAIAPEHLIPARLEMAEVRWAGEEAFPLIIIGQGGGASGIIVDLLSDTDVARLDFYEGSFEYALEPLTLADGQQAEVYLPGPRSAPAGALWSLQDWERDWATFACNTAREYMEYFGRLSAEDADEIWPNIQARGWSKTLAAQSADTETFQGRVDVQRNDLPYSYFFAMRDVDLQIERFDGAGLSETMRRAVFLGRDAALVLPYDPGRDRVLLVEQFRMGPWAREDAHAWQLEPVAGHVDVGETPEQAARREAVEEAGLTLTTLENVAEIYASPGTSTEFYHCFVALCDLPSLDHRVGGAVNEGENIRTHVLSFDAFMTMLDTRMATNAPTVTLGYWLAHHRARLRAQWAQRT